MAPTRVEVVDGRQFVGQLGECKAASASQFASLSREGAPPLPSRVLEAIHDGCLDSEETPVGNVTSLLTSHVCEGPGHPDLVAWEIADAIQRNLPHPADASRTLATTSTGAPMGST